MRILHLMKTSELIKFKSKWNKLFLNFHIFIRMITAYDLHKTLKQFLKFSKYGIREIEKNGKCRKLFKENKKSIEF